MLAFPDGAFSEDATFDLSDVFAHTPKPALTKNFALDQTVLNRIPKEDRFIFQAAPPPPLEADVITDPQGQVKPNMVFRLTREPAREAPGGRVRIADTTNFPIAAEVSAALVEVEPGHIREIHWHPNADEWQYYMSGKGRMSVFGAAGNARTFDFQAGDVGYVPKSMSHFIENTGESTLRFLELFNAPRFMDMSLKQWMALTPHELVAAHVNLPVDVVASLPKSKQVVI